MATISFVLQFDNISTVSLALSADQVTLAGNESTSSKETSKKRRKDGQQFVKDPTNGPIMMPYNAIFYFFYNIRICP